MSTIAEEVAYCTGRIARSTALAEASTDSCARASHFGIAKAYGERLAALDRASGLSAQMEAPTKERHLFAHPESIAGVHILSRQDMEVRGPSDCAGKPAHLAASFVAAATVVRPTLAGGSSDQQIVVHNSVMFGRSLLTATSHDVAEAADVNHLADRGAFFAHILT